MDSLLKKHPNRVPVYLDKKNNDDIPELVNHKFLIPKDMTVAQFMVITRKRIHIDSRKALFIFVNNSVLPPNAATFGDLYETHAREDGILYTTIALENTFR